MSFVFICATVHVNLCDTFGCKLFKTQFLRSCCVTPLFCLRLRAEKPSKFAVAYYFRNVRQARQIFPDKMCSVVLLQRNFVVVFVRDVQKVKLCRKGAISATGVVKGLQKVFPIIDAVSQFRRCVCSGYQKVKLCRKGAISATGVIKGLQKVFPTIDTV